MLCRSCNILLKHFKPKLNTSRRLKSQTAADNRDPAPLFFNSDVQQLLKKLTRVDFRIVFRKKRYGERLETPEYKFLTTEELEKFMKDAEEKAEQKLQMPPVVKKRSEEPEILSRDYELQGYSDSKFVFTDITFGVSDRERLIIVRESNGELRKALPEERHCMNEAYFPEPGRKLRMPKMFEKEHLKRVLDEGNYEFVLDRACIQFEPDDPKYEEVTKATYEAVDVAQHYGSLRSTRHFGPFAFHLAWNKCIDNLLLDLIQTDKLDEAVALIQLYHVVNPDAKSASTKFETGQEHNFITEYVTCDSNKRSVLELALQTNAELHRQKEAVKMGIRKAHVQT